MNKWTEAELAYLAGLIDGEGSIGVQVGPTPDGKMMNFTCRLNVSNSDVRLGEWLQSHFGGAVHKHVLPVKHHLGWKQGKPFLYHWSLRVKEVDVILPLVLPYLILKAEQARLLLEYRQLALTAGNVRHLGVPPANLQRRYEIVAAFAQLNQGRNRKYAIPLGITLPQPT